VGWEGGKVVLCSWVVAGVLWGLVYEMFMLVVLQASWSQSSPAQVMPAILHQHPEVLVQHLLTWTSSCLLLASLL
jgi:hypothetical protein